jgi:hypothetical protein
MKSIPSELNSSKLQRAGEAVELPDQNHIEQAPVGIL